MSPGVGNSDSNIWGLSTQELEGVVGPHEEWAQSAEQRLVRAQVHLPMSEVVRTRPPYTKVKKAHLRLATCSRRGIPTRLASHFLRGSQVCRLLHIEMGREHAGLGLYAVAVEECGKGSYRLNFKMGSWSESRLGYAVGRTNTSCEAP
jgi:hypothetical protein